MLFIRDMYENMTSCVKWKGDIPSLLHIKQDIRQGEILSIDHYKGYNDPLLLQLEEFFKGVELPIYNT